MKFSFKALLTFGALLAPTVDSNQIECATAGSTTASTDFYPDKVSPVFATQWSISYHGTYKILTNNALGKSYLLHQCGTDPPADQMDGRHESVVAIPPQSQNGVIVTSTPQIPYIELLGVRTSIEGYVGFGGGSLIASPCLNQLIDNGSVGVATDGSTNAKLEAAGIATTNVVALVNKFNGGMEVPTISIDEFEENSYQGTMEWIKVFGAIFNLEAKANELFEEDTCRFNAIDENVQAITPTPKILWAYYSDFCGGWDVAEVS